MGEQWGSDQKGPITPTSWHGANYFIIFIDYFSSYIIHFFLPSLDLTYKAYCNLRAIVSTHLHKKIRHFIADRHSTYTSNKMKALFEFDGTDVCFHAPYDPNGNAKSERTIRTVTKMARTLLISSGLPGNLWQAAIEHTIWIQNRVKSVSHHDSSPFELFWNVKPDLCHLHPFGCLALALIPKDKQKKTFDSKVKNSVFIGFLLFDLTTKTEFVSCDVHFYNDQFPCQKDINFQPSLPKVDSHQHSSSSSDTPSTPDEDTPTQPDEETLEESQPSSPKPSSSSNNQPPTHQYSLQSTHSSNESQERERSDENTSSSSSTQEPLPSSAPSTPSLELFSLIEDLPFAKMANHEVISTIIALAAQEIDTAHTPKNMKDALSCAHADDWRKGIKHEFQGLQDLKVFLKPSAKQLKLYNKTSTKIFRNHTIFKLKTDGLGNISCYKARCVLQGQTMLKGIHFDDTFSPCSCLETLRIIVVVAVQCGWKM